MRVHGPISLQGEYALADVNTSNSMGDPSFTGAYVAATWTLTGESRTYKNSEARFGTVSPDKPFDGEEGGNGAWELALRYSMVDLADSFVTGGELNGVTVGVNWYLNPFTRMMFNYVFADLDDVGDTHIFQTRFQVDF